jgi:hypothetical protein
MQNDTVNQVSVPAWRVMSPSHANAWLMLFSRSASFLAVQAIIALGLLLAGKQTAWTEAARWWPFFAVIANGISVFLLVRLFRQEGSSYLRLISFSRATWKGDLLWFIVLSAVGVVIAEAPRTALGAALFGDSMTPTRMMFQPLPTWGLILSLLFPLTIGLAELPTYFGYAMPRLGTALKNTWVAWLIASFFLAAQHMFLPFLPDTRFMLWRLLMFLPFALWTGLCLKLRPTMLPYYMIAHALMDITALSVYLML